MDLNENYLMADQAAHRCQKLIRRYAVGAGLGSAIPLPVTGVATDAILATAMLKGILRQFGLRKADIDLADIETKALLLQAIKVHSCQLVGKAITKQLIVRMAARTGSSYLAKGLGKYIPVVGQIVAGGIGYATMKSLGELMIRECLQVTYELIRGNHEPANNYTQQTTHRLHRKTTPGRL